MEYFEKSTSEIILLNDQIEDVEHQLNQMVFYLYGLTEQEIQIIEDDIKGNI